ncbi:MAG: pantoate--beta-alanine ligase [Streptosporangiales bacterium]|nr:pantoate--beta-alanine ligase [Streptosporangiales bacterium]
MKVLRTVRDLRDELRPARRAERTIGLVPTMGFLHEGHLSLIRRARRGCDVVVMSSFVNPAQFDRSDDLAAYPRDEERDVALAEDAGADIVFAPPVEVVYPDGFTTSVRVLGPLTETLEGAHRGPSHFHGVTTVVTKLFAMVQPDVAYFGQKDAQQAVVVRRLVHDLDLPVRVEVCPIVREPDGLALSSRNVHLHGDDRKRALALRRGLDAAEASVREGVRDAAAIRAAAVTAMGELEVEPEYVAVVDPETLAPLTSLTDVALVAVAARVGGVRLIDNTTIASGNGRSR